MTAYQQIFFLAVSSGLVLGVLVAFPMSKRIAEGAQRDRLRPSSPQAFMINPSTPPTLQTKVAGTIVAIDHEHRHIRIDALSPYPEGEHTRLLLTYSASTTVAALPVAFIQPPEADIRSLRAGTRIMVIVPRIKEGQLHVDKISILP